MKPKLQSSFCYLVATCYLQLSTPRDGVKCGARGAGKCQRVKGGEHLRGKKRDESAGR